MGHSFAGSELNYLGARHPTRVQRLVYLDSGIDYSQLFKSPEWKGGLLYGLPQPPTPSYDDDAGTAWSWTLWAERLSGPGYPEAEVRAVFRFDAQDRFVEAPAAAIGCVGSTRVCVRLISAASGHRFSRFTRCREPPR